MSESVSVIIVAAGNSSRTGGIKKQFVELKCVPVVVRSVRKFQCIDRVTEIIVVTSEADIGYVKKLRDVFRLYKVKHVIAGGKTRQQSVFNGFEFCDKSCSLIAVHDAARPFVKTNRIQEVFNKAVIHGAALLGAPVKDTIKKVEDDIIVDTPERSSLYQAQTPQVFKMDLYCQWVIDAVKKNLDYTDDCQLAEAAGINIAMVKGDYDNIKITTPEDIILAKHLAEEEES